jgi:hypothetical protein
MHSKNISCGQPLRFLLGTVYRKGDVSVVHAVLCFSVPLLVDSSGRGGLTSAEVEKNLSRLHQKAPSRELNTSRGFRRF